MASPFCVRTCPGLRQIRETDALQEAVQAAGGGRRGRGRNVRLRGARPGPRGGPEGFQRGRRRYGPRCRRQGQGPRRRSARLVSLRRRAGEAWSFRALVESEAALRFDRLAAEIAALDAGSPVPASMCRAADDARRHEKLCAGLAAADGEPVREASDGRIAPARLPPREAALYEVTAACCITETESMATLATLLPELVTLATRGEDAEARVREVLH